MKSIYLTLFMVALVSCSGSMSTNDAEQISAGIELAEADDLFESGEELLSEAEQQPVDDIVFDEPVTSDTESLDSFQDEVVDSDSKMEEKPVETMFNEGPAPMEQMQEEQLAASQLIEDAPVIDALGQERNYQVGKSETLMLIAFKIYGDYGKWKKILEWNRSKLNGTPSNLRPGMNLTYYHSGQEFSWSPGGNPYLIKWGDTLGGISEQVYGTYKKWKGIWEHNRPVIKDPNKIYVGFTIYYLDDSRGMASQ